MHNLVATLAVLASVTGILLIWRPSRAFDALFVDAHVWGGAPLIGLVALQMVAGRRIIFRSRRTAGAPRYNRVYALVSLLAMVMLVASGVPLMSEDYLNPVPRLLCTQAHRALTWVLVPAIIGHAMLSTVVRWQRARARAARAG